MIVKYSLCPVSCNIHAFITKCYNMRTHFEWTPWLSTSDYKCSSFKKWFFCLKSYKLMNCTVLSLFNYLLLHVDTDHYLLQLWYQSALVDIFQNLELDCTKGQNYCVKKVKYYVSYNFTPRIYIKYFIIYFVIKFKSSLKK